MKEKITNYLKNLKINPNDTETLINLGKAYQEQENYQESINCYNKVLNLEDNHIKAICCLVSVKIESGEYTEGLNIFKTYFNLLKCNKYHRATLLNSLYSVYLLHKMFIKGNYNYQELFFNIGKIFYEEGLYKPAINIFECTRDISNSNIRLLIDLAHCYIKTEDPLSAEKILELKLSDIDIFAMYVKLKYQQEKYIEIIDLEDQILNLNSTYIESKNFLALSLIRYNNLAKALNIYHNLFEENQKNENIIKNLAITYKIIDSNNDLDLLYSQIPKTMMDSLKNIEEELTQYKGNLIDLLTN